MWTINASLYCRRSPSVEPVDKQKYSEGSLNYIGRPTSVTLSSGKVYKGSAHIGTASYDVRIKKNKSSGEGSGGSAGDKAPGMLTSSSDFGRFTMYVQDSSGTALDWTGYMAVGELDWNSKQHEDCLVQASCIEEQVYTSSNLATPTTGSNGSSMHYKAKNNGEAQYAIIKVHIPTSGMQIGFATDLYANTISMALKDDTTLINTPGVKKTGSGWSAI